MKEGFALSRECPTSQNRDMGHPAPDFWDFNLDLGQPPNAHISKSRCGHSFVLSLEVRDPTPIAWVVSGVGSTVDGEIGSGDV